MASKKQIFRIGNALDPFANVRLKDLPREVAIKNMTFDVWGNLCKRAGYAKFNTDSISADHKITGLHRFYKQTETSKYTLVVCDTGIYVLAESAGHAAGSSLKTVTADSDTYFIDFVNRCLIANGKENLMKFNGTVIYTVGITVPAAPSYNSFLYGEGDLSLGKYFFKCTFVDEDGNESNASPASSNIELTGSADGVKINIASGGANIAKRKIYRTLVNGASYYEDGTVSDNSTLTFSSTQSDVALVQANSLENYHEEDHYAPPNAPSLIAKKGGRIYLAVIEKLYFSKRFYEYFPTEFFIPVGNMRSITGIISQLSILQVATKNSVERLLGTSAQIESADYFQFKDSYSSKGAYSSRSVVDCDNYIVFLHKNGLYILNIDQVQELNPILNAYLKTNMNQDYIGQSCAVFYDGLYMLSYPKGESHIPSETVWYDFRNGTYGVFNFAFNVYSVWGQDGEDSLKAGSTTIGRVYDVFSGLSDDDSDIEAYDTLPFLYFGNPDTFKQIYNFYIKIKSTTGTALRFYYQLDSENGIETETYKDITLVANKTRWYKVDLASGGQRCRGVKVRPRMSDQYYWEEQGIHIVYRDEEPLWGAE